jgi:general secretion pathway protein A
MYAPFFGLSKEPFSIAPDPRFLFMSDQHREALAHLLYGLRAGGGFVLLTGEIGAGKTTVFRCFLEQVPPECTVAYVFNPKLTVAELLQTVCMEFGLPPVADPNSVKAHVDLLNAFLLAAHGEGRQAILVIDEAQSLSADVLEQLRLLTNLETTERKLLQIVLIGQPELRDMLARPELEQLAQRVIARYHLGALSADESQQYIRHRMAVAGTGAQMPFDGPALARIHALSRGVPRRINLLADRALLGAYAQGRQRADARTVNQAALEVFGQRPQPAGLPRWGLALAGALVLGVALGWGLTAEWGSSSAAATASGAASVATSVAAPSPATAVADAAVVPAATARNDPPASARVPTQAKSPAPVPAGVAPPPGGAALDDPAPLLAAAQPSPATAWRELALQWHVAVGEGEPCSAVAQAKLACLRSAAGGLPLVRQLARPGLLTLRGDDGQVVYAQLLALGDHGATLQAGSQRFELTLPALARVWRGEFATLWRTPPGWRPDAGPQGDAALRTWVAAQLSAAGQAGAAPLAERVRAFQVAQGLPPDGVAGPMTLIALMRLPAAGSADEPRLGATR